MSETYRKAVSQFIVCKFVNETNSVQVYKY